MKKTLMALTSVATLLCANGAANAAGTIQGNLGVTLTIGAGCVVGGGNSAGSANDLAPLASGLTLPCPTLLTPAQPVPAVQVPCR